MNRCDCEPVLPLFPDGQNLDGTREQELEALQAWVDDGVQVIALDGFGGIGKTAIAGAFTLLRKARFDHVFGLSLENRVPLGSILSQSAWHFSCARLVVPDDAPRPAIIRALREQLKRGPCLLLLDNMETIVRSDRALDRGYEGLMDVVDAFATAPPGNLLLITVRELPTRIRDLARPDGVVRTRRITGLPANAAGPLLREWGLPVTDDAALEQFVSYHGGNPKVLKLVIARVRAEYGGSIGAYVASPPGGAAPELRQILDWHIERLNEPETTALYRAALARRPFVSADLVDPQATAADVAEMTTMLTTLEERHLLESAQGDFLMQSLVREYATERFVATSSREVLERQEFRMLRRAPLLTPQAPHHVVASQRRAVLAPLLERLTPAGAPSTKPDAELLALLAALRGRSARATGYAGGNLLNLLVGLQPRLRDIDLSRLTLWNASLQEADLQRSSLQDSDLRGCDFADSFSGISAVALSPGGLFMAAGMVNGSVRMWNRVTWEKEEPLQPHGGTVRGLAFIDDDHLLTAGDDGRLHLYERGLGEPVVLANHAPAKIIGLLLGPGGRVFWAYANYVVSARLPAEPMRATGLIPDWSLDLPGTAARPVRPMVFLSREASLLIGDEDGSVRRVAAETGERLPDIHHHDEAVLWMDSQTRSPLVAVGGFRQTSPLILDLSASEPRMIRFPETASPIWDAAFCSEKTDTLATAHSDGELRLWREGVTMRRFQHAHTAWVRTVAADAARDVVVSGSEDQSIKVWDADRGECIRTVRGYTNRIWSVDFSSDGSMLAAASSDGRIRLWTLGKANEDPSELSRPRTWVRSVAFHPSNPDQLVSVGDDGAVVVWSCGTGHPEEKSRERDTLWDVCFSPDGQLIATAGEDRRVLLWHVDRGSPDRVVTRHDSWAICVRFSPDRRYLASAGYNGDVSLDPLDGRSQRVKLIGHSSQVWGMAFCPDGDWMASGDRNGLLLVSTVGAASPSCKHSHGSWVRCVAIHPRDRRIVVGDDARCLSVYDRDTGRLSTTPAMHSDRILTVAFSPDGQLCASAGDDGVVNLWSWQGDRLEHSHKFDAGTPYTGLAITGSRMTRAQRRVLVDLGATEQPRQRSVSAPKPKEEETKVFDPLADHNLERYPLLLQLSREPSFKEAQPFAGNRAIFVLHFLRDLVPFTEACRAVGLDPAGAVFLYKDYRYPYRDEVAGYLKNLGITVAPLGSLDDVLDELDRSMAGDSASLIVVEDGGYIVPRLITDYPQLAARVIAAVEQTTRGLRNDETVADRLSFPLLPVAAAKIKGKLEPDYIARSLRDNLSRLAPSANLVGSEIALIGYGAIGKAVAGVLHNDKGIVTVFDTNGLNRAEAGKDGHRVVKTAAEAVRNKRFVIGTTGRQSIEEPEIDELAHNAILVSASSDQVEFDTQRLGQVCTASEPWVVDGKRIGTRYTLPPQRAVGLVADGYPINFWDFESMPGKMSDAIMSIVFLAAVEAAWHGRTIGAGVHPDSVDQIVEQYRVAERLDAAH